MCSSENLDYAGLVLNRVEWAEAEQTGKYWQIWDKMTGKTLSGLHRSRDEAWKEAAKRVK